MAERWKEKTEKEVYSIEKVDLRQRHTKGGIIMKRNTCLRILDPFYIICPK
jgi:hypothetical protein